MTKKTTAWKKNRHTGIGFAPALHFIQEVSCKAERKRLGNGAVMSESFGSGEARCGKRVFCLRREKVLFPACLVPEV